MWIAAALVAVVVAVVVFALTRNVSRQKTESVRDPSPAPADGKAETSGGGRATTSASSSTQTATSFSPGPAPSAPTNSPEVSRLINRIESTLVALQRGDSGAVNGLRDELRRGNPRDAIAAIQQFLDSGRDAGTGGNFAVGEGGALEGSPTLRVFLLDQLGQLARQTGGTEAAQVARAILETKNSADEWAVSLRNVAWAEKNSGLFLANKLQEMLTFQPWLEKPSTGMLESFDVAVYTQDANLVPRLAELVQGGKVPLQQASGVALDRLAEAAPLKVMTYLNSHPGVLAERPLLRADYFAKADLSDPAQKQAVEAYLARPDVALPEKTKLVSAIAEPASFVSDSLLTTPPPAQENPARQDALATAAGEWTHRFPELAPQLSFLQSRLRNPAR